MKRIYMYGKMIALVSFDARFPIKFPRFSRETLEKWRKREWKELKGGNVSWNNLLTIDESRFFREWQWTGHWTSKSEERSAEREVKDNRVCSSPRYYWRRLLYPRQNERPTKQPPPIPDPHSADITCDRLPPRISNLFDPFDRGDLDRILST